MRNILAIRWLHSDLKGRTIGVVAVTMEHDDNIWRAYLGNYDAFEDEKIV